MTTPTFHDPMTTLYCGDVLEVLAHLPPESVHCVVSSPPYWGLRQYKGNQERVWGGGCEHKWSGELPGRRRRSEADIKDLSSKEATKTASAFSDTGGRFCQKCSAWRGAFGLEPTIELYIAHSVEILRAIRRVLRDDGTCFINIGDSYAGSNSGKGDYRKDKHLQKDIYDWEHPQAKAGKWDKWRRGEGGEEHGVSLSGIPRPFGLKPKDLCLIPFRLAIALQSDGWYVRSVIIWHKPNPMPESVNGWRWERCRVKVKPQGEGKTPYRVGVAEAMETRPQRDAPGGVWQDSAEWADCPGCPKCIPNDGMVLRKGSWRPTEAHEYILMLAKSETYFGDAEAVREPQTEGTFERYGKGNGKIPHRNKLGGSDRSNDSFLSATTEAILPSGRNLRSVWTFPTESYSGAHFAVFPSKLPETCILAGTSEAGVCAKCGAPYARIIKYKPSTFNVRVRDAKAGRATAEEGYKASQAEIENYKGGDNADDVTPHKTLGWRPSCKCGTIERQPAVVLDPFCGSGTTLAVAKALGRRSIGIDISSEYCALAQKRIESVTLPLQYNDMGGVDEYSIPNIQTD